jgi:hypothetical protein
VTGSGLTGEHGGYQPLPHVSLLIYAQGFIDKSSQNEFLRSINKAQEEVAWTMSGLVA